MIDRQEVKDVSMTKISLQLYSVREHTQTPEDLKETLKKVRNIGYPAIQGGRAAGMTKEEYKEVLDSLGISMTSYAADLPEIAGDLKGYIEDCHYFGQDEIMIGCLPAEYRRDEDTYRQGIAKMNEVGRELKKEGIYLSFHNHAQEFRRFAKSGRRAADMIFEETDPQAVRFIWDTHWIAAGGEDVLEWIRKSQGRMQYLHVKDLRVTYSAMASDTEYVRKEWAEIGEGNLPWDQIIRLGESLGIKAYIVEQDQTYERDPFDAVEISYKKLRKLGLQ